MNRFPCLSLLWLVAVDRHAEGFADFRDDPVFSGFVSTENRDALAGTPSLIAERSGDGSVILFADNPSFRGYWYGTNKLFLNALFFSTVFDAPELD